LVGGAGFFRGFNDRIFCCGDGDAKSEFVAMSFLSLAFLSALSFAIFNPELGVRRGHRMSAVIFSGKELKEVLGLFGEGNFGHREGRG
jgi:hypothetical protein